jgi:hypothetical protein
MQSSSPNSRYSCSKRGLNLKRELVQFEHGEHCSLSASLSLVVSSRDSILKTLLSQPAQRVSPFGLNVRSKAKKEAFLRHEPDLRIQSILGASSQDPPSAFRCARPFVSPCLHKIPRMISSTLGSD